MLSRLRYVHHVSDKESLASSLSSSNDSEDVDVEVDANYHRMADIDVAQQALLKALHDRDLVDGWDAAEVAGQDAFFAERVVI